jgi:hypothetical protein
VWRLGTVPSESGYRIVPQCHAPAWQSCQWVATAVAGSRNVRSVLVAVCGPNHGAASVAYTSVPDLVGLARDGTDAQKEQAAGALWNCAVDNPANKDAVRNAGGIGVLVALARDGTDAQKERAAGALKVFETAEAEAATKVRAYLRSTRAMYRRRHVRMRMHARAYACLDAPGCAHAEHVGVRASARARVSVRAFVLRARAHICGCPSHPSHRFAWVKSFLLGGKVSLLLLLCPRELLSMRLAET